MVWGDPSVSSIHPAEENFLLQIIKEDELTV
jgi:hypothetical protein